jgi:hypothetical protein
MLANLAYANEMDYRPYREYATDGDERQLRDFMSADWAWNQAVSVQFFITITTLSFLGPELPKLPISYPPFSWSWITKIHPSLGPGLPELPIFHPLPFLSARLPIFHTLPSWPWITKTPHFIPSLFSALDHQNSPFFTPSLFLALDYQNSPFLTLPFLGPGLPKLPIFHLLPFLSARLTVLHLLHSKLFKFSILKHN